MLKEYADKIKESESVDEYEKAVKDLVEYLKQIGQSEDALKLETLSKVRKNRFSSRETREELYAVKTSVADYCKGMMIGENDVEMILKLLNNFPLFCRNLYKTSIHKSCSEDVKNHLTGFSIENEFDLQKLMLAVMSAVYTDARIESAQDSGHHTVRKDIVIDSIATVIELKCTRLGMTERQLSEEVAADMIHYNNKNMYFFIYDKVGIIKNTASFQRTYEEQKIDEKNVHVIIYNHDDI